LSRTFLIFYHNLLRNYLFSPFFSAVASANPFLKIDPFVKELWLGNFLPAHHGSILLVNVDTIGI